MTVDKKLWNINLNLLPVKLHYFIFYGAMGGVQQFMPLLAKGLGINATAVGLVYTVLPFCVFFSKPAFGYVTDYFRNLKLIVFMLMSLTAVTYISVLLIPALENTSWTDVQVECPTDNRRLFVIPKDCDKMCLQDNLKHTTNCELNYLLCNTSSSITLLGKTSILRMKNSSSSLFPNQLGPIVLQFVPKNNSMCDCIEEDSSVFKCARPDVNSCFAMKGQSVYTSFPFWMFTLLAVISGTGAATIYSLSDALCYDVLGDRPEHYGRQRLWAATGWGCTSFLAGSLNDFATGSSEDRDYAPGFYLMVSLVIVNLILLPKIKLTKTNFSINICKDVSKVFSTCEPVVFAVSVWILGAFTGLILSYQFWFLQDLGATQTLLGLTVAVPCLLGEVPVFYFTGWVIKQFGYIYCLIGFFTAFSVRLGLYYILENPWWVLPIELMHGFTFAVFLAALTGYASDNAPPGTEATMMGILGGLFDGLGVATGSLLGGVGFDKLGGRTTFLVAGAISSICTVILIFIYLVLKRFLQKSGVWKASKPKTNGDGAPSSNP